MVTLTLCCVSSPGFARPMEGQDNHRSRRARILETFDLDGDGKLGQSERAEARKAMKARMLERFDTNGDGTLDDDEKKSACKARRHRQRGRHGRQNDKSPNRQVSISDV